MARFLLSRLALAVLVALAVSVISFALLRLSGDLARVLAGEGATTEQIAAAAKAYGLDRPLHLQYLDWLDRVLRGDLGQSLFTSEPVMAMILKAAPLTLKLALLAITLAIVVAIPLGMLAAARPNSWTDRLVLLAAVGGKALPSFWLALLLLYFFGVWLRWLPISGAATWKHFVLPVVTLAVSVMPELARLTRSGMIDTLESDFIRMAWAKGLSARTVFFKHALRNAILPVVALSAISLGFMLGGSVVVESIFALNGIGALAYKSILRMDFPAVQGILFVLSFVYIVLTLLADVLNAWLDPRIKVG